MVHTVVAGFGGFLSAMEQRTMSRVMGYRVRYSARAKRLQIKIRPWVGVEVVVPKSCSSRQIKRFVAQHQDWIERKASSVPPPPEDNVLPEMITLRAVDARFHLIYRASGKSRGVVQDGSTLWVPVGPDSPRKARHALRRWLAQTARCVLVPQLNECARQYGFDYHKVSVRGQRTRWGSCSAQCNINLNYKLLFVAPELVEYLLVHELAHTRELNHSSRFWQVVESCLADYRRLDRQLSRAWQSIPAWVEAD